MLACVWNGLNRDEALQVFRHLLGLQTWPSRLRVELDAKGEVEPDTPHRPPKTLQLACQKRRLHTVSAPSWRTLFDALPADLRGELLNAHAGELTFLATVAGGRLSVRASLFTQRGAPRARFEEVERLVRDWGEGAACATSVEEWCLEARGSHRSLWPAVLEALGILPEAAEATFALPGGSVAQPGADTQILWSNPAERSEWTEEFQKRRASLLDTRSAFEAVSALLPSLDTAGTQGGIRISVTGFEGVASPFRGLPQTFGEGAGRNEVQLFRKAARGVWGVHVEYDPGVARNFGAARFEAPFLQGLQAEFIYPMERP
ncbi:MAG: hypothetical protein HYZ53_02320 [Planctomycetes bacterium]|nr:hypothetical protein [Planctomycetota bacterium]